MTFRNYSHPPVKQLYKFSKVSTNHLPAFEMLRLVHAHITARMVMILSKQKDGKMVCFASHELTVEPEFSGYRPRGGGFGGSE